MPSHRSPVALLKFQIARKLRLLTSSGFRKMGPKYYQVPGKGTPRQVPQRGPYVESCPFPEPSFTHLSSPPPSVKVPSKWALRQVLLIPVEMRNFLTSVMYRKCLTLSVLHQQRLVSIEVPPFLRSFIWCVNAILTKNSNVKCRSGTVACK